MAKVKTIGKYEKLNITASANNGVADIRIVDYIGAENNDDTSIRAIVDDMLAQNIKTANIYLNSQGGSVFAAAEMANQLARFDNVKITVGSLAASAATYLTSKFYTIASPNSQFMVHKPSTAFFGNSGEMESEMKLLKNLEEDYKAVYAAKTGMTPEDIDALWAKGDYWMNAQEAFAKKFVDEIITANVQVDDNDIALLRACGAPAIPTKVKSQNTNMERLQLIAALGLAADATDETITAKLTEYKIKAQALDAAKANEATQKKERANALVDRAILGKKIIAEQKETYVSLATDNYDAVSALLDTTPAVQAISGQLPNVPPTGEDAKAAWTMEEWQEKDPEGLAAMFDKDRAKFEALQAAYAKKK